MSPPLRSSLNRREPVRCRLWVWPVSRARHAMGHMRPVCACARTALDTPGTRGVASPSGCGLGRTHSRSTHIQSSPFAHDPSHPVSPCVDVRSHGPINTQQISGGHSIIHTHTRHHTRHRTSHAARSSSRTNGAPLDTSPRHCETCLLTCISCHTHNTLKN